MQASQYNHWVIRSLLVVSCLLYCGLHIGVAQSFKTSCVSWCFHGFGPGQDPRPAIDTVANLGFDGIQLMISQPTDLDQVWTTEMIQSVRARLKERKLELVSLVPFFPCFPDLGSNDPQKVKASLANFERCCQLAQRLGTRRLEIIGPYLSEFNNPKRGNPYFEYKIDPTNYQPGTKLQLDVPANTDWDSIWKRMVGVIRNCSTIAQKYGLQLVIEPHIHSIVPDTNGFLLLWQAIKDPNIRLNSDTGWGTQQCEYPPMNVYRTKDYLQVMQFRDVDNLTRNFVPMGLGVVNIQGTLDALKQTQFDGYVSFEEVFMPTAKEDAVRFLKLVKGQPVEAATK